ncbi:MAG: lamin tail domain-containing protein, partial [Treponema sp.]|nr:lamin tail domain-containing protein [Treponema sp.]
MKKRKPPLPGMLSAAGALACVLLLAACPTDGGDPYNPYGPYQTGISDPYEGKLLILQTYGTGPDTDGAVSHNFVELYNKSEEALDLAGITLQYADGKEGGTAPEDPDWKAISLSGTVPAGHSFLILGKKSNTSGRLQLTDGSGDINDDNFVMNNHAYKAALLRTENAVSAANPFSPKLPGYIDMIGAVNAPDEEDSIDAYETGPLEGIKKHGSARR